MAKRRKFQSTLEMYAKGSPSADDADLKEYKIKWKRDGDVLWGLTANFELPKGTSPVKVASYDADGTLIDTISGRGIAKHANDWRILSTRVERKLRDELAKERIVVIFTNQAGIQSNFTPEGMIRAKFEGVVKRLRIPCAVFVSCTYGISRKPAKGMWTTFTTKCLQDREVDMDASFFVGDAAGRKRRHRGIRNDHSDSDRKFALNIGLRFLTPEEYFDGDGDESVADLALAGVDPSQLCEDSGGDELDPPDALGSIEHEQQMIILVGFPGAGKSTFTESQLEPHGVVRVNMDTLGTKAKCMALASTALEQGHSVAVDNTNPRREVRRPYVELARRMKVPVRAFVFRASRDLAKHLNAVRENMGHRKMVPPQAFSVFESSYEPPSLEEGFRDIVHVTFRPKFRDDQHKQAFLLRT